MMKKITYLFSALAALFLGTDAIAQCAAGEVEITIEITTDDWGYEAYWDLTPTGNGCGSGALIELGNTNVGCAGAGAETAAPGDPGDMGNNVTFDTTICLMDGVDYDINSIDDWGDGGTIFNIISGGIQIATFTAAAGDETFTFTASEPLTDDLVVEGAGFANAYNTETNYLTPSQQEYSVFGCGTTSDDVTITVLNNGVNAASNFDINYELFDGTTGTSLGVVTETISGPLASGATMTYTFATSATLTADELFTIDAWTTFGADLENANDSLIGSIVFNLLPYTVDVANPFYTGFEQFGTGLENLDNAWAWTAEDGNGDGSFYSAFYDGTGVVSLNGDFGMYLPGNNTTAGAGGDDWLISPCMTFDQNSAYTIRFQTRQGGDGAGGFLVENLELHLTSGNSSGSIVETIGDISVDDGTGDWREVSISFSPTASGDYNIAIHKNTGGVSWWSPIDEFYVEQLPPPAADFSADQTMNVCQGVPVNFTNLSVDGDTYLWTFTGGTPATSTDENPTVSYAAAGTYAVELTTTNAAGDDTETKAAYITVSSASPTEYYVDADGDGYGSTTSEFLCETSAPAGYSTDNTDCDDSNPAVNSGATEIPNNFIDDDCVGGDSITAITNISFAQAMSVFPNPATNVLNVSFELNNSADVEVAIYTLTGQVIEARMIENATNVVAPFNVANLNSGVYMIRVKTEEGIATQRFVVSK